ncbi:MAG: DUF126 domain-containing protein [Pseudomonadota bacterium]
MLGHSIKVDFLIPGTATGPLLHIEDAVSIWGGIDIASGRLIEAGHPDYGATLAGKLLVGGKTKGSTAGPGALLELMHKGCGPAGFLTFGPDPVLLAAAKAMNLLDRKPAPIAIVTQEYWREVLRWCRECPEWLLTLDADACTASVAKP